MKKPFATLAILVSLFGSPAAHAGIPVLDAANLTQAIMEVLAWAEQYGQMIEEIQQLEQQYNQAVQQYDSLTGSRGLGDIMNNQALQGIVPTNLASTYNSINSGGYSGLSSPAKSLRDATKIYNCEDRTGAAQVTCQATLNQNSQTQANLQNALDLVQQRTSQIQSLQSQINSTSDPKAIAELQARIQSENTQVSNDANRIALMQATAATHQQAAQQQLKERELKWLSNSNTGLEGFHFPTAPTR